jgi:regulator of sirC expression with transglutaminase-like and TPR domain
MPEPLARSIRTARLGNYEPLLELASGGLDPVAGARGVARLHLRDFGAAKSDLENYLRRAPNAEDRAEITRQLEAIHRWLGRLN